MEVSTQPKRKLPVTNILSILLGVFAIGAIVGGFWYLDYQSGSTSSSFHPNGMEVEAVTRGFSSGTTSVGTVRGEDVPDTMLLRVDDYEFRVTEDEVVLNEKMLAQIPPGTKKLSIVSYRERTSIEADGTSLASVP